MVAQAKIFGYTKFCLATLKSQPIKSTSLICVNKREKVSKSNVAFTPKICFKIEPKVENVKVHEIGFDPNTSIDAIFATSRNQCK